MLDANRERRKEYKKYKKNYYYKRKKFLHYLINSVNILENVCACKQIFKFRNFLNLINI